ncbi:hypothetical protein B0H63DRAFT_540265 [Podospora didyma]|uniref:Uncharacterized protein n=1 Tax=Podospora didyma TaxID=330526 RepID=A0AAE0U0K6_9PEZI|nr:hypothetical protein B0H63DRAFT_540265 [Podospora didyma]
MNCLRKEASRILNLNTIPTDTSLYSGYWPPILSFHEPKSSYITLQACLCNPSTFKVSEIDRSSEDLASFALDSGLGLAGAGGETPAYSLKLVNFQRDSKRTLHVDRSVFLDTFRRLSLDEYALYLYLTDTPGLHFLGSRSSHPSLSAAAENATSVLGFYVNCIDHTLIWSYNQATGATNAISIVRYRPDANTLMRSILTSRDDCVMFNPLFLGFVSCFQGFSTFWNTSELSDTVGEAELMTYTQNLQNFQTMELDHRSTELLVHLSNRCVRAGSVVTTTESKLQMLRLSRDIARRLEHESPLWDELKLIHESGPPGAVPGFEITGGTLQQQTTREIQHAVAFLQQQIEYRIANWEYIQKKSRETVNLIMGRIQRTDTVVNKRDSSSMNVIAMVTMAFLPSTFLATLFAVPALQESVTLKSNFYLYMVCAVPTTGVVFLLWGVWTERLSKADLNPSCIDTIHKHMGKHCIVLDVERLYLLLHVLLYRQ